MRDQKAKHSMYFSGQLFADWFNPPTGRRSRSQSNALAQHYESKDAMVQQNQLEGLGMIGNLIKAANNRSEKEFYSNFVFGVPLKILRKGNIKQCVFFVDQNLPSFLWISTKSKAFLFDLTYTTIQRFSFEIERVTNLKHYFILYYFEEELPVVFEGENASEQVEKYYQMIQSYIVYNRIVSLYPSYFSQVLKRYIIEEIKENVTRQKKCSQVLKVACDIGWNTEEHNKNILKQILEKKGETVSADLSKVYLTPQEINDFFKICSCCIYTKEVFQKYAGVKLASCLQYLQPCMRRQAFRQFLIHQQAESAEFVEQIFQSSRDILSFYDFSSYLLNQQNNYAATIQNIDENLPLTDYFCYSSHNTYLSGNQLTSDSKIERYLEDLDNGLKCVQIDVHNDGQRPIITHAFNDKSFCKPIDFQETIKMIGQFCKKNKNHYPLILSIENHAKEENRYRMFNILYKVFDKKLFMVNSEVDFQKALECKTLAQLKGKVIIKTDSKISEIMAFKSKLQQGKAAFSISLSPLPVFSDQAYFPNPQFNQKFERFEDLIRRYKQRKNLFQNEIQRELYLPIAEMTKITGMFKTISGIDTQDSCGYECTSLTNEKAAKADEKKIIAYTKRSWLRIYPLGSEIASSNYNPVPHLRNGAQIIALNTQTKDDYAWLLMSYFICGREINPSKIGYVPKPPHLLKNSSQGRKNVIRVVQIKNLSTEKLSIRFFGSERDIKTNANASSSFNVSDYLQGFLMFNIGEKFKDCIPLRFIRQGYRVLVAKNEYFRDSGIRVLVQIQMKQTVWS